MSIKQAIEALDLAQRMVDWCRNLHPQQLGKADHEADAQIAAALAALRSMPQGEPVATIRYERGTPGKENDMPKVVSCNWLPDGVYSVYATPHTEAVQPDRSEKIPFLIPSNPGELTEAVRMSEAWQPIDHQGEQT